ncbi:DUF6783 domain-containing protein [[Clostridium] symbiosum]
MWGGQMAGMNFQTCSKKGSILNVGVC